MDEILTRDTFEKNKLRLVSCWLRENLENYQDEAITNCWNLGASFRGKGEKRVIERKLGGREEGREKKGESEQDFFLLSLLFLFLVLIRFSPTSVVNLTKFPANLFARSDSERALFQQTDLRLRQPTLLSVTGALSLEF